MGGWVALGAAVGNMFGVLFGVAYCVLVLTPLFGQPLVALVASTVAAAATLFSFLQPALAPLLALVNATAAAVAVLPLGPPLVAFVLILLVQLSVTAFVYLWTEGAMLGVAGGVTAGPIPDSPGQALGRGLLFGLCAGANLPLMIWFAGAASLVLSPAVLALGPVLGLGWLLIVLGVFPVFCWLLVNFASITPLARSPIFQGFLGWFAWFMPMAVPNTLLGLAIFVLNRLAALASLPPVTVPGMVFNSAPPMTRFDWRTGTVITVGGWMVANADGYNNGNFVYVDMAKTDFPDSPRSVTISSIVWHETGHTLDNAAFGWMFQLVCMLSSKSLGASAYGERTAEGRRRIGTGPPSPRKYVPLWGLAQNTQPVAVVNAVAPVVLGSVVTLVGAMNDPESAAGSFFWDLGLPTGSMLSAPFFPNPHLSSVSFTPDVVGNYVVGLVVNDGIENSANNNVTVVVTP